MEEKKRAVAKKLITPNMQEWLPVSPKMPEKPHEETTEPEADQEVLDQEASDQKVSDQEISGPGKQSVAEILEEAGADEVPAEQIALHRDVEEAGWGETVSGVEDS